MLSKTAIDALKKNETAKGRIATATGRSMYSVNYWLTKNSLILTADSVLQIIMEETGLNKEEILTSSSLTS